MVAPGEIELSGDEQHVVIDLTGGGLRSYSARGREVLDGYQAGEASPSGRGQVLIPWPNRLEGGSYEFDGRRHQLALTEPERENAIHGLVRFATWSVAKHEARRAVVEHLLEPQPGYPFSLALSIEYSLSPSGLRVETTATNTGTEPAPYGSGAHPYLTTPEHDGFARKIMGPSALLAPEHKVVVGTDTERARAIGRKVLKRYLALVNYRSNLLRLGFSDDDLAGEGSDRLVDALVLHGDPGTVAAGLRAHLEAGADHICIQVLGEDLPAAYRALNEALL